MAYGNRLESGPDGMESVRNPGIPARAPSRARLYRGPARDGLRVDGCDGALILSVSDDGVGGADPGRGSGLIGLTDRVEALGGTISVLSPPGHGTALHVHLPADPVAVPAPPGRTL